MLNFITTLILIACGQKGLEMMAMLFATKVILGKITYAEVPAKLKPQVAEILRENGLEELIVEA